MIPNSFNVDSIPFKDGVLDINNWDITKEHDVCIRNFSPQLRPIKIYHNTFYLYPITVIDNIYIELGNGTENYLWFNPYCYVYEDNTFNDEIYVEGVKKKNKLCFQIRTNRFIIEIPQVMYLLLQTHDKYKILSTLINLSNPSYKRSYHERIPLSKNRIIREIKHILSLAIAPIDSNLYDYINKQNYQEVHDLVDANDDKSQMRAWLLFRKYLCDLPKDKLFNNDKLIIKYLFEQIRNNFDLIERMKLGLERGYNKKGLISPEKRDNIQIILDLWDYYKDEVYKMNFK
ncbi:MAG: hypothetical protein QM500_15210 [Methylococcales bacterium]